MPSIHGRQVRWYDPVTGRQLTKTLSSEIAAQRFAKKREEEAMLYRDGYLDAEHLLRAQARSMPITEAMDGFRQEMEHRQVTLKHRRNVMANLRRAIDRMRPKTVQDLTRRAVDGFCKQLLREGRSAATHNRYRRDLHNFGEWLVRFEYLTTNPVDAVRMMDESKDRREVSRALTVGEVQALLESAGPRRAVYLFRVRTGLRCLESQRVLWSDIDMEKQTLSLRAAITKNGRTDVLPLSDDVCESLVAIQRNALRDGRPLGDHPFPKHPSLYRWWRDIDQAGITRETTDGQVDRKCLRNTLDSFLLHAGVHPVDVMLLMRHAQPGGMQLTLGLYGDEAALLQRKRQAIGSMMGWIRREQQSDHGAGAGSA